MPLKSTKEVKKYRQIIAMAAKTASIYTNEWVGCNKLKRVYDHSVVKHNAHQYVNGRVHTNTIEGF